MFSLLHCYYPLLPFKIINYYYICYQLDNLQMWDQNFTLNTFAYCFLAPFCHLGLKKSLNQEYFGLKGPNWHSWLPFVSDCDENSTFSDQNCPVYTFTSVSPPRKDTQTAVRRSSGKYLTTCHWSRFAVWRWRLLPVFYSIFWFCMETWLNNISPDLEIRQQQHH